MAIGVGEFEYIRQVVHDGSAIVLEPGKEYLAEARLLPLAHREGFGTLQELVSRMRGDPASLLRRKVVEAMTTNETSFFRDLHPFEALRKHVLPDLSAVRASERRLNIWCAACSTGQEPYSIAMLLREHFSHLKTWSVRLIASDLSAEILARAREGRYNQLEVNRGLPAVLLVKYFQQRASEWRIADDIRSMVEFVEINLAKAWPPLPSMDVILMRNVLIYFGLETKKRSCAKPGSYCARVGTSCWEARRRR